MNRPTLYVLTMHLITCVEPTREAAAQFGQTTPNDTLKAAEVLDDSRVTFRIDAPKADAVQLASSGIFPESVLGNPRT